MYISGTYYSLYTDKFDSLFKNEQYFDGGTSDFVVMK